MSLWGHFWLSLESHDVPGKFLRAETKQISLLSLRKSKEEIQATLSSIPEKMIEQTILENISESMKGKKEAESHQHGFTKRKFMPHQPKVFPHETSDSVEEGRLADVVNS